MFKTMKRLLALLSLILPLGAGVAHAEPMRFSVEVAGEGPDVILIPGLASSREVWRATARQLEDRYRVHLIQVAGFAESAPGGNAEGAVVGPMADEIVAYIAQEHLDHPAIIGHSMGGFTGLLIAARHPESVGRLMVVDALPFFSVLINPAATAAAIEPQAAGFRDMILAQSPGAFAAGQARAMATLAKTPKARADALAWSLASDRGVIARTTYDVMTTDLRGDLAAIKAPVTVVYARDPEMGFFYGLADGVYAGNYATLKGVQLKRVDGAFHFVMLDQPQAFAAEVEAFLK
ncbi:MAG: alpha/beta hydrolase [Caulobacter sp.]|nr:alpha/beta hydrolase [Caulobacter sp.]